MKKMMIVRAVMAVLFLSMSAALRSPVYAAENEPAVTEAEGSSTGSKALAAEIGRAHV